MFEYEKKAYLYMQEIPHTALPEERTKDLVFPNTPMLVFWEDEEALPVHTIQSPVLPLQALHQRDLYFEASDDPLLLPQELLESWDVYTFQMLLLNPPIT
jgi:hypothetical protein